METIFKEFEVSTATVAALLVLDFVLNNQRLFLEVEGSFQRGGDGVMGSLAFSDQTRVALDDWGDGLLDLPLADITKCLSANRGLFGSF